MTTFKDKRKLLPLQQDALDQMYHADKNSLGVFLWMLVGSGKTRTVLEFIKETKRCNQVLWCLPKSAIKSVALEITRVGWKYCILSVKYLLLKKMILN